MIQIKTDKQKEGVSALVEECATQLVVDKRQIAYILATVYHETGSRMQPVKEFGSDAYLKSKSYYPYYGRDLVQTTWYKNYKKVRDFTGLDVINNPDLMTELSVAVKVAVYFMSKGLFTGKKLSNYFDSITEDWVNARKIINGLDKAELIAGYAHEFFSNL